MAGERILIIENDPERVEFLLANVLLPHGYLAQTATCGRLGLQAAQEERPDLVLLGLGLQDKTVAEMLQQLQVLGNPPVVLMMPSEIETKVLRDLGPGARDALTKSGTAYEMTLAIAHGLCQDRLDEERDRLIRKLAAANAELERSLDESQALCDAGLALSSSLDLQNVLATVVQAAVSLTRAERGYLFLRDSDSGELELKAAQNLDQDCASGLCVQVDDKVIGHILRSGEAILLPGKDATVAKKHKHLLDKTGDQVRSSVNVPLHSQGHTVGVLGVDNVESSQDFAQRDVKRLSILANYASSAISNAQTYTRIGQTTDRRVQEKLALQELDKAEKTDARHIAAQALTHAIQVTGAETGIVGFHSAYLLHARTPPEQDLAKDITWIDSEGALSQPGLHIESLMRHALDSGEPQWRQDTALSGNQPALSTCLAVPFQYMGEIMGVIGLQTHSASPPHPDWRASTSAQQDMQFLADLADRIAGQLYRMRLLAEVSAPHHKTDPVLQNIAEGVCIVSDDLHITSVNPAMERITGWQESELLGRRYDEIFVPKTDKRRLLPEQTLPGQALCALATTVSARHTVLRQDGHRIPVTGKATLLRNADASVIGVVTTMRDLTSDIELEQLRHAFKSVITHSLGIPLTYINASVEALLQTNLPDDVRHEVQNVLQAHSIQLDQLAGGVPNTRRSESETTSPHYHAVTLKPIIEQVVKYFQTAATNCELEVRLTPDLPFVIGDENKIELALANIIDNALIQNDLQQPIVISADTSNDNVIVAVERIGQATLIGDAESSSPLSPVNGKNTLTGNHDSRHITLEKELHTARKLIQAQGGQIWIEGQPGTDTRFCFSLPKMEVRGDKQALID